MATRASVSSGLLKRFRSKGDNFLLSIVTEDETLVHYYEPEKSLKVFSGWDLVSGGQW